MGRHLLAVLVPAKRNPGLSRVLSFFFARKSSQVGIDAGKLALDSVGKSFFSRIDAMHCPKNGQGNVADRRSERLFIEAKDGISIGCA